MEILSFIFLVLFFILGTLYFIPAIIAYACNKAGRNGILLVNFLLGWTVVGWLISLIWALSSPIDKSAPHSVVIKETYEKQINRS
jgi:hypothetical protein